MSVRKSNELWFTVLGPNDSGKTSLLASMLMTLTDKTLSRFFGHEINSIVEAMEPMYKKLQVKGNGYTPDSIQVHKFGSSTEKFREYSFEVLEKAHIKFFDFPGGWLNFSGVSKGERVNYERVTEVVRDSMVVIVAINTPCIMEKYSSDEEDCKYAAYAKIDEIQDILSNSMKQCDEDKLILLVPMKCEKYTQNEGDAKDLLEQVKNSFHKSLELNEGHNERLAIAVLPVHTIGNVEFSRFEVTEEDRSPVPKFLRNGPTSSFNPRDTDQPFRYAVSFLMNQYVKRKPSFWEALFSASISKNKLKEFTDVIRSGMHENKDRGFEVICGRELIGFDK